MNQVQTVTTREARSSFDGLLSCALLGASLLLAGCMEDDSPTQASTTTTQPPTGGGTSVNRAPTVTGTPGTTTVAGTAYQFQPAAADADGDALTFSVVNRPAWASFNPATGRLSGTPAAGDVGTYTGIVISVSDGRVTTALPAFTLDVTQIATGAATLSWLPPQQNTDGSQITNLSGYRIYYGTSRTALTRSVDITNASVSSYVIDNLAPATWYFAVKALAQGVESDYSNIASKTIS